MNTQWRRRAACKTTHVSIFYPNTLAEEQFALSYCKVCEVTSECRQNAINNNEEFGIWGGTTPTQRRKLVATRNTH